MSALTHGGRQLSGRESWAPLRQKAGVWTAQDSHGATLAWARILTPCGAPSVSDRTFWASGGVFSQSGR